MTHAQGTFPEPLESASNSFVCTRPTELLLSLFNQSLTAVSDQDDDNARRPLPPQHRQPVQLIRFPADRACRSATADCDQCLTAPSTTASAGINANCTSSNGEPSQRQPISKKTGAGGGGEYGVSDNMLCQL